MFDKKYIRILAAVTALVALGCGGSVPAQSSSIRSAEQVGPSSSGQPPLASNENAGGSCVGEVAAPPEELAQVEDADLLQEAIGAEHEGKLCMGRVFIVREPVTVYRVWNRAQAYTLYGRWWSFSPPQGPREAYRETNCICPSWSHLDRVSSCSLKVGAKVVVGPGQSARCDNGEIYPQSATNQVYIPNDSRNDLLWVEDCTEGEAWP